MKELGIMGGAFNPVHFWHLTLGDWALHRFSLDQVLYVPSGEPPHKKEELLDKAVRLELLEAGIAGHSRFQSSRLEIDRPGVSWSIDTLRELKTQHPSTRLNFIIGQDNVQSMEKYDLRAEFQALARLLIAPRGESPKCDCGDSKCTSKNSSVDHAALLKDWRERLPDGEVELLDCPASSMASKDIRKWIATGQPYRYAVPEAVYKIIEERGLYKAVTAIPAAA